MESAIENDNSPNLETTIRRYRGIIYRCITKVLKDFPEFYKPAVMDDIFQDVCILLIEKLEKYDSTRGMKLMGFIEMIAMHETYDFLRRQRRKSRHGQHVNMNHLTEMAGHYESPEDAAAGRELEKHILAARDQLIPSLCRAFDLEIIEGITDTKDLADAMEIEEKTVYTRRIKLRKALASALPEARRGYLEKKKAA